MANLECKKHMLTWIFIFNNLIAITLTLFAHTTKWWASKIKIFKNATNENEYKKDYTGMYDDCTLTETVDQTNAMKNQNHDICYTVNSTFGEFHKIFLNIYIIIILFIFIRKDISTGGKQNNKLV